MEGHGNGAVCHRGSFTVLGGITGLLMAGNMVSKSSKSPRSVKMLLTLSPESDVSTLSISVGRCLQLEGSGSSWLRFVLIGIVGIRYELVVASSGPGPVVVIGFNECNGIGFGL